MMLLTFWWLIGQILWLKALERLGGKACMKNRNHLFESTDPNLVCLVLITQCPNLGLPSPSPPAVRSIHVSFINVV